MIGAARQPGLAVPQGPARPRIPRHLRIPGFCKSATLEEVRKYGHVLTPWRYVGAEAAEADGEPFEQKIARLSVQLQGQFAESARLEEEIRESLRVLGL